MRHSLLERVIHSPPRTPRRPLASTSTTSSDSSTTSVDCPPSAGLNGHPLTPIPPHHPVEQSASIELVCSLMRRQIISRAFYGWLAYCRHLSTVRTHLSGLVHPNIIPREGAESGLSEEVWRAMTDDKGVVSDKDEVHRLVYYGGVQHEIRRKSGRIYWVTMQHPKIKLFITQSGLQSTEEALDAGVPMIGVPMLGDQWYNVEKYVTHGIGVRLDLDDVTEETFTEAINKVIGDESYRQRVKRLHNLMRDEPLTALERAVWWTEHVLRHGGARHLRAPAANMSWVEVYEVKLIGTLLAMSIAILICVYVICKRLIRFIIHSDKLKKS